MRQAIEHAERAAFRMKNGALHLAKISGPIRFVWTWPEVDVTALDPTSVTLARDPADRWFVTFHVDVPAPCRSRPEARMRAWTWA